MVLSRAAPDSDAHVQSTFASRYVQECLPRFRMPDRSIPKDAAYQIISDELMLDGNPRLNLASFVSTWMEPECDKLIMQAINKNYVDMDEYPITTEFQNRCVNIIANLFNAPLGDGEEAVGVATVGSSEAIMLAGLAFKRKWQNKRKAEGKPYDKPNIVTGANVQVCWEKFARYFEVELKEVKLREGYYVMDPVKAVEMVDENTICVAAILGSTYNGEFEDVKLLNDLLVQKNKETGFRMPDRSIPKDAAYQIINDELMLDGNPRLNLASFVSTWMEPECDKLMMQAINKNYVDMDEYPITTEFQNRCVNIIANLFNAPLGDRDEAVGVATVGSSEAIMLAGLAFKRKWQNKRKAEGKPYDKPNIVTGANVQVCWEKFARYFEVELKEVKLREGYYVMDPVKAVEMVDENTICVAAILGSTYNGEFEDVKLLNDLLIQRNKETGWDTGIHVDAASGGFVAPFLYPDLEWDFRLPLVKSINVSGHKYGLVYAGVGWAIWRTKQDLPEELIFHINYLGADQPTFTLNFSKGASQIIAQYYQLTRLGFEGYQNIMRNCAANAKALADGLVRTGRFNILSKEVGVPLVAFSLKDSSRHDVYEISDHLRRFGWIVPAYTMAPDAQHVTLLRVVIREDFNRSLAERLVRDIEKVLRDLDALPSKIVREVTASLVESHPELKEEKDMEETARLKSCHVVDEIVSCRRAAEEKKKFVFVEQKPNRIC